MEGELAFGPALETCHAVRASALGSDAARVCVLLAAGDSRESVEQVKAFAVGSQVMMLYAGKENRTMTRLHAMASCDRFTLRDGPQCPYFRAAPTFDAMDAS